MYSIPPIWAPSASVSFVGAGPGAGAHVTLGAYGALQSADVVIHDRLVGAEVLALIPAHILRIDVGKVGFGAQTPQADINALIVLHAQSGAKVVRLKGGDTGIFGRLDEEISALEDAGIAYTIVPGLTAASAAAAAIGQSLTQRGRNAALRIITGHDMAGFAEQDWRSLARKGEVAAIYMGKKSAQFIQGRLLMHGADGTVPVTLVENASHKDQRVLACTLNNFAAVAATLRGPAVILYGIAPRGAAQSLSHLQEAQA
jgi:uroporphyrin-III C-methyltransferase